MSIAQAVETGDEVLLREDRGRVAWLTLNRPDAFNALSTELLTALIDALDDIAQDKSVRAVVLGANGRGFCAGHDMKQLKINNNAEYYRATFKLSSRVMQGLVALPQPVIARVHGLATAAGCQLVASCDLVVAADVAKFATPGVNIGLFCSTPMVAISRALPRKQMMEMLLTGEAIDADKARAYGLVNRVASLETLDDEIANLTDVILSKPPLTLKIGKEAFYKQLDMPLADAYDYASEVMTRNMLIDDAVEGIDAFLEKRAPNWIDV